MKSRIWVGPLGLLLTSSPALGVSRVVEPVEVHAEISPAEEGQPPVILSLSLLGRSK